MLNWIKSIRKKTRPAKGLAKGSSATQRTSNSGKNSTKNRAGKSRTQQYPSHAKSDKHVSARGKATIYTRHQHGISRQNIDKHALKVLYRLHKSGYHACLVGGAVRDLLLGVTPKDFDIATDATPEEVNRLFKNCRLIGRRFRLAHVHFGRLIIEVATFRTDHDETPSGLQHESGRIMRDNVYGELSDDVWRRDFTANALYYDIADFSVIDFVGGFEDIQHKHLRLIGDEETRYREDPVRMLRAIRFSAKLDFEIDDASLDPIHDLGHLLQDIPPARLYEEFLKLFHSGHAERSLELLLEFDLLQYLVPEAARSINNDETFRQALFIATNNTDDRIKKDLRVTPAFLLAAFLWDAVRYQAETMVENGMPYSVAIQKAATRILSQQSSSVSIPKRFSSMMRDIWGLQARFHYRSGKRALAVLEHEKFRAGYDFLCIRAQAYKQIGEHPADEDERNTLQQDCQFWTDIQALSVTEQKNLLFSGSKGQGGKKGGRKRRRRRPSSGAKPAPAK